MGLTKKGLLLWFLGCMFMDGMLLSQGATRYYDFVLEETNFTRLCSTKSMLTVNGSFPGPEIHVHKGDTVFVNVHNQGKYGVTIHWHGVKQPRNPWYDGPENVTQCPIKPGTNFTQEVIFSTEEGTLWWHAHSDWSRATVHGAIIIHPKPNTTYPFTEPHAEQTIVLGEWYKGDVMAIINEAAAKGGDPNVSDAFTINGQPGDQYNCSADTDSMYRMLVEQGKTYLLRIINAIMNEEQFFAIANHSLTVVATDAAYLKPITTDYIMISPGQTMDVLVTADQSPSHYYIASTTFADTMAPGNDGNTTAIFQYKGNYTPPATVPFPPFPAVNDTTAATNFTNKLKALASTEHPVDVPKNISRRIFMTVSVNNLPCGENKTCDGPGGNRPGASLSNVSFATPTVDVLQAYYLGLPNVFNKTFPSYPPYIFNFTGDVDNVTLFPDQGAQALMINYNETVEIVFQGTNLGAAENHPMHLHGFSFYLVGTGFGNFNITESPKTYNLKDPPEVNTFGVPKNGWATIRFLADNPGVWFMHCHLERHATWGMANVVIVRNGTTAETSMRAPPAYMPSCT